MKQTTQRGVGATDKVPENAILWPFIDFAEKGDPELFAYLEHCGIALDALSPSDNRSARDLVLDHYRLPSGAFDVDMAARDLVRWPPIAKRISELKEDAEIQSELRDVVKTTRKISGKSKTKGS